MHGPRCVTRDAVCPGRGVNRLPHAHAKVPPARDFESQFAPELTLNRQHLTPQYAPPDAHVAVHAARYRCPQARVSSTRLAFALHCNDRHCSVVEVRPTLSSGHSVLTIVSHQRPDARTHRRGVVTWNRSAAVPRHHAVVIDEAVLRGALSRNAKAADGKLYQLFIYKRFHEFFRVWPYDFDLAESRCIEYSRRRCCTARHSRATARACLLRRAKSGRFHNHILEHRASTCAQGWVGCCAPDRTIFRGRCRPQHQR